MAGFFPEIVQYRHGIKNQDPLEDVLGLDSDRGIPVDVECPIGELRLAEKARVRRDAYTFGWDTEQICVERAIGVLIVNDRHGINTILQPAEGHDDLAASNLSFRRLYWFALFAVRKLTCVGAFS